MTCIIRNLLGAVLCALIAAAAIACVSTNEERFIDLMDRQWDCLSREPETFQRHLQWFNKQVGKDAQSQEEVLDYFRESISEQQESNPASPAAVESVIVELEQLAEDACNPSAVDPAEIPKSRVELIALYDETADCLNAAAEDFYIDEFLQDASVLLRVRVSTPEEYRSEIRRLVRSRGHVDNWMLVQLESAVRLRDRTCSG